MDEYRRGPPHGQHPPPSHDSRPPPQFAQPPPPSHHPHPQQQHGVVQHQPPPPPSQHHQSYQPPPPSQSGHHPAPPPPQPYPQQQHQQQQHPQHTQHTQQLPPIQPASYAPAPQSSEQSNLPPFRHSSAQPPHEQQREGQRPYPPEHSYSRSGHATPAPAPAPVNRTYSHDSGQQRTPATPTGPAHFPHSSGHEGAQQPPQGAPPPPQSMDHGGHPGYPPTNGVPHHGMPHPPPPHHEQHPQYAMTPIMDQHHQYPPPGQAMYGGTPSYGPTASMNYGPKRKQMRATQACEQCRQRKQKCDEGSPCSFCKENNLSCQYRDTPPAKTDKNMEKLLSYMEMHSQGLADLTSKIDNFEARLRRVEQNTQNSSQPTHANHTTGGAEQDLAMDEDMAPRSSRKPDLEDHRTAPHKLLLLWPSVRPLLKKAGVEHNDGYVMEAEDRGVLRLWTRGEGIDAYDGTQAGGPASPARSDETGDVAHMAIPSEGLWGSGFPSTPGSNSGRSEPNGAGGLKANGQVDLDANTVNQLYESYIRNIHIMHPFLDKKRLRQMFDNFIRKYSSGRPRATFAVGNDYSERPLKRQRSNGSGASNVGGGTGSDSEAPGEIATERSPGNAIVYLVMALGKICLHTAKLPGIVKDSKLQANTVVSHQMSGSRGFAASSPVSANIKPSPMSPKSTPTTQPTPPSEANMRMLNSRSRRNSVDGSPGVPGARNLDVIPGIAYYARAAEILGDQGDGNDLVHAQMFLLAGLYKGQLARVKESMSWITMAGRAILILLDRYKLYNDNYWDGHGGIRSQYMKSQARIKDTRQSLIVLASWTCLQLESDILAELRLPASGIQAIEHLLLMPHKVNEDETYTGLEPDGRLEDYDNMLIYYSAQLFLRRRLNQVHREMYGKDSLDQPLIEVQEMLRSHESILEQWRRALPDFLKWADDDEPAKDILSARLRAKYWGARYVINRPFLDYALHIMPHVRDNAQTVEDAARDGYGNPRDKADIHLFKAIQQIGDRDIWAAAKRCIDAAMHSTVALDGVPSRLIVTNIHGTAHAQFGNMLVLSAVHNSTYMGTLVPEMRFKGLLERTIKFLRNLSDISPTCSADCGILEKFHNSLFGKDNDPQLKKIYHNEGIEPSMNDGSSSAENSFQETLINSRR
ncbi:Putative zn(2)-C6 fungal-type DNA-binding domain-containing protein [Septoria linicola]|uniref:Zn(2)-C6 fungal-type DNA-binding domain-containing protein n=1 Tax=Septoria linicola TaxID=215465 RepID=A0A9Q9B085_9PEZI|nr:putative zn(2)-C6 fungal-type DNA-binding domain-containing protein [Septoria linicola]USW56498.1 Putative zn(2)-C6 fungal-type DNA-binding domain-containing protein [Septoria linicola]